MNREAILVVHLTSVHPPDDVRIYHKEARSLAEGGYDVRLVAPIGRGEVPELDGVGLVPIPRPSSRLERLTVTLWRVFRTALALDASVYHFHCHHRL